MAILKVYTDGACSQNGTQAGGWGVFIEINGDPENNITISGGKKDTTNNEMELTAFLNALKTVNEKFPNNTADFFLDSAYIVNTFKQKWYQKWLVNGYRNSKKETIANLELWKEIFDNFLPQIENGKYGIHKIKGHSNNYGNEIADMLAVNEKLLIEESL